MTEAQSSNTYHADALAKGVFPDFMKSGDVQCVRRFFAALPKGSHVVEVGCGTGSVAALATQAGLSVRGIDACPEVVDASNRRQLEGAEAVVGDACSLDLNDGVADAVVCLFLLQDLTKEQGVEALKELHRIAKPGAPALIAVTVNRDAADEQVRSHRECRDAGVAPKYFFHWHLQEFLSMAQEHGFSGEPRWHTFGDHGCYTQVYFQGIDSRDLSAHHDDRPT